ncbi:hypothetical protein AH01_32 [Pantoea phage AH01]|nr:hypothetical protein AH01_32 [Pantoea phage AH01]
MADNIVIRERYNGLVEVNGQFIPQRGEVKPEELVQTQPDDESAHNNGGGVAPKRRRRNTIDEE